MEELSENRSFPTAMEPLERPPRIRFGFGGRLLLAFGVVAASTVAAGLLAWIAFVSVSNAIQRIQDQNLPAITLSAELAEKGAAVVATAPQLIAAQTENERERVWDELQLLLAEMSDLTPYSTGSPPHEEKAQQLKELLEQIAANLVALDLQVKKRFVLAELLAERTDRLRWIHADFLDEIDPMVVDARFNLESALERIDAAGTNDQMIRLLEVLREETRKQEALLKVNASGNLAVGLLVRGSSAPDGETLNDTIHFHGEVSSLLQSDLTHLENLTSSISLRQICLEILSFGQGNAGLFAIRRNQLDGDAEARLLLDRNRELVGKLKAGIASRVREARADSLVAIETSNALVGRGKLMLSGAMTASLAVAVLVGWFYVGRNLVVRVTALSDSMRAIAGGDLTAAIPTGGRDEISVMADALLVFRDTAVAVEEANTQAIIDNAQAGLLTTDAGGEIAFFNPTAMALFGYGRETEPAGNITELIAGGGRSVVADFFQAAVNDDGGALLTVETVGKRRDGTEFPMDMTVRAFMQRRQKKFIVTIHDVTERKHAQDILEARVKERTADLRSAVEQLQREIAERRHAEAVLKKAQAELVQAAKLAALGQLAAGIAHELNQPLTAIRSYTHNAGRLIDMGRAGDAVEILERITLLTQRMADISKHLKNLARRPSPEISSINLKTALENALALFGGRMQREQVVVAVDIPDEGMTVLGEEVRMEQVFINLISNALDAMQTVSRGKLTISAARQKGHRVRITVSDTGCGMTPEELEQIFDPFYTTKEVDRGLGLGLTIAYNIVKDWNGSLKASSRSGQGAAFELILNAG